MSSDAPPTRSPLAVQRFIADRAQGKDLVTVGGALVGADGLRCFKQHANTARAVANLKTVPGDADLIAWWARPPLDYIMQLHHLLHEQRAGHMRENAEALLVFDGSSSPDLQSWDRLCPLARWSARIPFDERSRCVAHHGDPTTCERATGHFVVAGLEVARLGRLFAAFPDATRQTCQQRHAQGYARTPQGSPWQLFEVAATRSVGGAGGGHNGSGLGSHSTGPRVPLSRGGLRARMANSTRPSAAAIVPHELPSSSVAPVSDGSADDAALHAGVALVFAALIAFTWLVVHTGIRALRSGRRGRVRGQGLDENACEDDEPGGKS